MEEKQKILIVEDSKLNQEILRNILQKDYKLDFAIDGTVALDKVKKAPPDIILLDLILPGMDGFGILTELKKCDSTRSIPVIIITGRSDPEEEAKGLNLGAVDYITKPFHAVVVNARVETQVKILKQMRIIEKFGFIDTLTNIPNRRHFDQTFIKEWNRAKREKKPISIVMIDVDHFKMYNDTHGHQQGDVALQTVAGTVTSSLKRTADIAARWGGEEFAVLLPNTTLEGAMHIAEEIRSNIEASDIPCGKGGKSHKITISMGVAQTLPDKDASIAELILQADRALYKAKDTGRNKVCAGGPEEE
ncbi:MAG: diguanylate cyclase [Oscillospiraceae bacterium]|nr:diguanylate cyclase [Oscillospiraceae bacterium]